MSYNKPYNKSYIPPTQNKSYDTGMASTQLYKIDNTAINNTMTAIVNSGNISEILQFFQSNMFSNFTDKDNNTPIHLIVQLTNVDQISKISLIKELIKPPLNINIDTSNNQNQTPLHLAIINQYSDIVKFLLDNKADPNKVNGFHQNAMHLALIPNIKPCEKKIKPKPIIKLNTEIEDKNKLYNLILKYIYDNHSKLFTDNHSLTKFLEKSSETIDNYDTLKYTLPKLNIKDDVKNQYLNTNIDDIIQNTQHVITNYLINPILKESDIKKNVYSEIKKSLILINSEYIKFLGNALQEIEFNPLQETKFKLDKINNILYSTDNVYSDRNEENYYSTMESKVHTIIQNEIREIENKIRQYNYQTAINNIFNKVQTQIIKLNNSEIFNDQMNQIAIIIQQNKPGALYTYYKSNKGSTDDDKELNNQLFVDILLVSIHIALIIVSNALSNGSNMYNMVVRNQFFNHLMAYSADKEYEIKNQQEFMGFVENWYIALSENISDLYEYMSPDSYLNKPYFKNKANDTSNGYIHDNISIIIDENDTNIGKALALINYISHDVFISTLRNTIINIMNGQDLKSVIQTTIETIQNISKNILIGSIGILDKIKDITTITDTAIQISEIVNGDLYLYNILLNNYIKELDINSLYKLYKNNELISNIKNLLIIDTLNKFYIKNIIHLNLINGIYNKYNEVDDQFIIPIIQIIDNEVVEYNTLDTKLIVNAFNEDLKEADYMSFNKKQFISSFFESLFDTSLKMNIKKNLFDYIYNEVNNIIDVSENEINIVLIKILDKLLINTIKTNIYYKSILKLKDSFSIFENKYKIIDNILESFQLILTETNRNQELDKSLNKLIISTTDEPNDKIIMEISDIKNIDISDNIITYSGKQEYILYYAKDYNSLTTITTQQCMYNTVSIIEHLLEKSVNFFKIDIKGNTPLYYVIQSGNYLLLEKIVDKYSTKHNYPLQSFIDKNNISPIELAFNMVISMEYSKPDYEKLNKIFINHLLTSDSIKNNLPKDYDKLYIKLIDYLYDMTNFNDVKFITKLIKTNYEKIVKDINNNIRLNKSISHLINEINEIHKIVVNSNIQLLHNIVNILEKRYDNTLLKNDIINDFCNMLIQMGIMATTDIINIYYCKIIKKLLQTANAFNSISSNIYGSLSDVINQYVTDHINLLVQTYYGIKTDEYDRDLENQTPINDFLLNILDHIAMHGIIQIDSHVYNNIKQYINIHMNELLSKTLDYVKLIIDVFHRWSINYYYSLKTFLIITKINNK